MTGPAALGWRGPAAAALAAALLGGGVLLGYAIGHEGTPSSGSADAGFARDMIAHHAQAVRMSVTMHDRVTDQAFRTFATDITTTQQGQIGAMQAWLRTWELTQTDSEYEPMHWMMRGSGHGSGHGASTGGYLAMPGMASSDDLARLEQLSGRAEEVLFLQLMIEHHKGGVEMARRALDEVTVPYVRQLADSIVTAQAYEIDYMERLLAART